MNFKLYREIVYIEDTHIVKIHFGAILNSDICITFQKKYRNQKEAFNEISSFLEKEKSDLLKSPRQPEIAQYDNELTLFINVIKIMLSPP